MIICSSATGVIPRYLITTFRTIRIIYVDDLTVNGLHLVSVLIYLSPLCQNRDMIRMLP